MGTYLTVSVIDKEGNGVASLQTSKWSKGDYVYAFDEESLYFERGRSYYYKMPIDRAIANLKEVKEDVVKNILHEKLDDWSKERLQSELLSLDKSIEKIEIYSGKGYFLYCDQREYLCNYEKDESKIPSLGRNGSWQSFRKLVQGAYFGENLSREQKKIQDMERKKLMKLLEQQDWIENVEYFTAPYDAKHLMVGNNIVNRFICTIHSPLLICKEDVYEEMSTRSSFEQKNEPRIPLQNLRFSGG